MYNIGMISNDTNNKKIKYILKMHKLCNMFIKIKMVMSNLSIILLIIIIIIIEY